MNYIKNLLTKEIKSSSQLIIEPENVEINQMTYIEKII